MSQIGSANVIQDSIWPPLQSPGNPVGTDKVETITIGGTPTGGSFTVIYKGVTSGAINWSSTNSVLLANLQAALDAMSSIGAGNTLATAGTLTAGIGTILVTFQNDQGKLTIADLMTLGQNNLTGTAPTVGVSQTTAGVTAFARGAPRGRLCINTANGTLFTNTSGNVATAWTVVGAQT